VLVATLALPGPQLLSRAPIAGSTLPRAQRSQPAVEKLAYVVGSPPHVHQPIQVREEVLTQELEPEPVLTLPVLTLVLVWVRVLVPVLVLM
jgi:hypothetical protein